MIFLLIPIFIIAYIAGRIDGRTRCEIDRGYIERCKDALGEILNEENEKND
jgi:hypothetical protein